MSLSPTWEAWRADRSHTLAKEGLPLGLAIKLAAYEATHRSRVAGYVGEQAAMNCELVQDDSGNFALQGRWDLVPTTKRQTVAEMMATRARHKH